MTKLLCLAFIFIYCNVFAQKKEFLVTNAGDTVFGTITLTGKNFMVGNSTDKKLFSADDVQQVHAVAFKGTIVVPCHLHLYSDNVVEMQLGATPIKELDTVMVLKEIYSTPKMNLYLGTDNLKTQYYFYKTPGDEKPVQLVVRYHLDGGAGAYSYNTPLYRGERSKMHIEEDKGYVNQLRFIMKDCTAISEGTWDVLQYRGYSLKNLIRKYNECD